MVNRRDILDFTSRSVQCTEALGAALGRQLRGGDVVTLDGPLGSGKTALVRGLARGMGLNPASVSSPTFIMLQEYAPPSTSSTALTLAHIDAYRLDGSDDLETIGWNELLDDPRIVIAIEWPTRIADAIPPNHIAITFEHIDQNTRELQVTWPAERGDQFDSLRGAARAIEDEARASRSAGPSACRMCGKAIAADSPHAPFCSPRCRMADLGKWFSGEYQITRPIDPEDEIDQTPSDS